MRKNNIIRCFCKAEGEKRADFENYPVPEVYYIKFIFLNLHTHFPADRYDHALFLIIKIT